MSSDLRCPVCSADTDPAQTGTILGQYEVQYRVCPGCEFWFLPEPHWLEEAYSHAISALDTGAATRNITTANSLRLPLTLLARKKPVVDWAGGAGLLTRLLRDSGIDAYWQDQYAENVYAQGFDWPGRAKNASVVTAIEVLEHTTDPVGFIRDCLAATGAKHFIFSQELYIDRDPKWWYLAPESGQHIAFFTEKTLKTIADQLGMRVRSAGGLHLLTSGRVPGPIFKRTISASRRIPARVYRKRSKVWADHHEMADRAAKK